MANIITNPLLYRILGFFSIFGGGVFLLYVWRKMNLDTSLYMHTARYAALLLSAAAVIWAGMALIAFHS